MKSEHTTTLSLNEVILNRLKKMDFMTNAVKNFFPNAKHKLITSRNIVDPELGNCYERIGYFYLPFGMPIIYTHAKISLDKAKEELIEELKEQKIPFGELLRAHYPNSNIGSQTIYFKEKIVLPDCYKDITAEKFVSKHERYILIDGEKIAIAIEYI